MLELEFVKLIRVKCVITLPDGGVVVAYRYMDIDGNIIAETVDGMDYPSSVRELGQKARIEAKEQEKKLAEKADRAKAEQEAQAEWDAMRKQMKESLQKKG